MSDLQPYIQQAGPNQSAQQPLHAIEAVLLQIRQDMEDCCAKGKLTAFMQVCALVGGLAQGVGRGAARRPGHGRSAAGKADRFCADI